MTRLLISVRSLEEFQLAVATGVDVVDVKEPARGSLGRAELSTIRQIANAAPPTMTLSVALGELTGADDALCSSIPNRIDYVKFGLAGCRSGTRWRETWHSQLSHLHENTRAVAVAYADARQAGSPPIEEVIQAGYDVGCRAILIDTYRKDAGNLFTHLSIKEIAHFVALVRSQGMLVALAGSLRAEAIDILCDLEPDLLAFRSAACRGRRASSIDRTAIRTLRQALSGRNKCCEKKRFSHQRENPLRTRQND